MSSLVVAPEPAWGSLNHSGHDSTVSWVAGQWAGPPAKLHLPQNLTPLTTTDLCEGGAEAPVSFSLAFPVSFLPRPLFPPRFDTVPWKEGRWQGLQRPKRGRGIKWCNRKILGLTTLIVCFLLLVVLQALYQNESESKRIGKNDTNCTNCKTLLMTVWKKLGWDAPIKQVMLQIQQAEVLLEQVTEKYPIESKHLQLKNPALSHPRNLLPTTAPVHCYKTIKNLSKQCNLLIKTS